MTVTAESFAFIAAVTLASSAPVTGVSAEGPRPLPVPVLAEVLGEGEPGAALARDDAPNTITPAAPTPKR